MKKNYLDVRNLLCPMPVIKVQNAIKKLCQGDRLEVVCTDPGTKQDIPTWCRINGHTVEFIDEQAGQLRFMIVVGAV